VSLPANLAMARLEQARAVAAGDGASVGLAVDGMPRTPRLEVSTPQGPKTWPSRPADSLSPRGGAAVPEGTPPLMRMLSVTSVDEPDGQDYVPEQDSVAFRERLDQLGTGASTRVESAERLQSFIGQLGDDTSALASSEAQFKAVRPSGPKQLGHAIKTAKTGAAGVEMLGEVMAAAAEAHSEVARSLRELVPADQREEEEVSVWKKVVKTLESSKQHPVLGPVEDLARELERATASYEEALERQLSWSVETQATQQSEAARRAREAKKAMDAVRLRYVTRLEELHADKEAELLERTTSVFFTQKRAMENMLATMEAVVPQVRNGF
jgi:hypothetical protein